MDPPTLVALYGACIIPSREAQNRVGREERREEKKRERVPEVMQCERRRRRRRKGEGEGN